MLTRSSASALQAQSTLKRKSGSPAHKRLAPTEHLQIQEVTVPAVWCTRQEFRYVCCHGKVRTSLYDHRRWSHCARSVSLVWHWKWNCLRWMWLPERGRWRMYWNRFCTSRLYGEHHPERFQSL